MERQGNAGPGRLIREARIFRTAHQTMNSPVGVGGVEKFLAQYLAFLREATIE